MFRFLGILALLLILFSIEYAYWLIPIWTIAAEVMAVYLDRKAK
jgi:hypothetical protein